MPAKHLSNDEGCTLFGISESSVLNISLLCNWLDKSDSEGTKDEFPVKYTEKFSFKLFNS